MIVVRFADDAITGFEYEDDARRFLVDLRERFARFGLELHPGKTRLIQFGRYAASWRKTHGLGKPETFTFLGFTHLCATSKKGHFWVRRVTDKRRMRAKLKEIKEELKRRRHQPVPVQGQWLRSGGWASQLLRRARQHGRGRVLPHPGDTALVQGASPTKPAHATGLGAHGAPCRPMATTRPPTPPDAERALRRQNPRQEPSAVIPHAGICAGAPARTVPTATYDGSASPGRSAGRGPARRPTGRGRARVGETGTVLMFTVYRLVGAVPGFTPATLPVGTP